MDRDDFIIAVYLVVCEHYQAIQKRYLLRRGGFVPALTDEEVITMEICGEYFKFNVTKTSLLTSTRTICPISRN